MDAKAFYISFVLVCLVRLYQAEAQLLQQMKSNDRGGASNVIMRLKRNAGNPTNCTQDGLFSCVVKPYQNLTVIEPVPSNVQVLIMANNLFPVVYKTDLDTFYDLVILDLHSNALYLIEDYSFVNNTLLTVKVINCSKQ